MKTSEIVSNGVRDSTEKNLERSWEAKFAEQLIEKERRERINADTALSGRIDVVGDNVELELSNLRTDMENECLSVVRIKVSELYSGSSTLMTFPDEVFEKDFVLIHNDGSGTLTELCCRDDYAGILSEPILAGETRLCKIFSLGHGGADPENGFVWVLPSKDTIAELKSQLNAETIERKKEIEERREAANTEEAARTAADAALQQRITSEETVRENADIALSDRINNEEDKRTDADTLINQRIDYLAQNSSRVRNCLLDIENYEDGNLLTDSKGNKYLSDIFSFDNSYYEGMHIEVNTFAKTPLYPSKLLFEIEVAGRHYSADNCDSFSILNPNESYIRIIYSDNTEESVNLGYGKSEISVTNEPPTADIAENYTCYKIKTPVECTKQIKSLVFALEGDNYRNDNDNPSGGSCTLELIVKKLACYDEECIAVFGDIMKLSKQMDEESAERRTADENIKGNISSLDLAMASMNSLLGTLSDELDAVNGAEG